jgi:hypothetical protein
MYLYLLSQSEKSGYDTYDSAVVAAPDERAAKLMHPNGSVHKDREHWDNYSWPHPDYVTVTLIGTAKDGQAQGVICSSFNAG